MTKKTLRVAALVPNVLQASPGQRSSIEAWVPQLREDNIHVDFLEFETPELHEVLYTVGNTSRKATRMLAALGRRLRNLPEVRHADLAYVYRESSLIGPNLVESILKMLNINFVYSLDDPIFVPYESPYQGKFTRLKFPSKIKRIVKASSATLANSHPLMAWARQFTQYVHYVPSAVDTNVIRPREGSHPDRPTIGWTGSGTTTANLAMVASELLEVQERTGASIHLMGGQDYPLPDELEWQDFKWTAHTEAQVVSGFDIGIAPMPDNPWNYWKYSGKVSYFMALGIPTVATPIGDISSQLRHGVDGFLAADSTAWLSHLEQLVLDAELRSSMGGHARQRALKEYSVTAIAERVRAIFRNLAQNV